MEGSQPEDLAAFVDSAAAMTGMPLDDERRAAVAQVVARIAAFAANLDDCPIPRDVEIAGRFVP
jgi:hypothetical protein